MSYVIAHVNGTYIAHGVLHNGIVYVNLSEWEKFLNNGPITVTPQNKRILIGSIPLAITAVMVDGEWHGPIVALANVAGLGVAIKHDTHEITLGDRRNVGTDLPDDRRKT